MTPEALAIAIDDVVAALVAEGALSAGAADADITVERPRSREHGDYATNAALVLARFAGRPPRDLAADLAIRISAVPGIASAEVAGPGFINVRVEAGAAAEVVRTSVESAEGWGRGSGLAGLRVNVEFISANPTGPIHLGHTRWAAIGDAIARVLEADGASVVREFYINDQGVQMRAFGDSLMAAAHGQPVPEDGYKGDYIPVLAARVVAEDPDVLALPDEEQRVAFREGGYRLQLREQQEVLAGFRTDFDVWYSERDLHESGAIERGLAVLRAGGHMDVRDGATWLRTTDFGDDKDRVLVRSDGTYTYFAADVAYYLDKRARGFDRCIYLLGADHHGYVNRLRALAACTGDDPDQTIDVLIGQLVKIRRGDDEVRLSKRAGEIVTLADLVDEIGVDAARYSLIRSPADTPVTLDLDLVSRATSDNPVFYVQYAHARISSVLRNAAELDIDWRAATVDLGLLASERESALVGRIAAFPGVVASAAELREPHRIARYLEELATDYHRFYDGHRVLPRADEELGEVHVARLWLCAAARQTFANGLGMLGVGAPERM